MEYRIRKGSESDLPFMKRMLHEAAFWNSADSISHVAGNFTQPELQIILQDWGRTGDIAFIAEISDDCPIGAAWFRLYTQEKHSYGFYNEETPEIAIAVEKKYRKKGIGTAL